MLQELPEQVFTYWLARKRLQDPAHREQALWQAKDKSEFEADQSQALFDYLNSLSQSKT